MILQNLRITHLSTYSLRKLTSHSSTFLLLLTLILGLTLTSCDKRDINGDLDGMWQIMEVQHTLDDGTETSMVPDHKYLCFQFHVCQLRSQFGQVEPTANLIYTGDTVTIDFPEALFGDRLPRINLWGIYSFKTTYEVVTLTKSTLVLQSADTRLTCRKF